MPQDWGMRVDKLGDDAGFVLSLVTIVLLFFVIPRQRLPKAAQNSQN
jgi:hypothetical protein